MYSYNSTSSLVNLTLNSPENASTVNESYVVLNATVADADNDSMTARLYGYYADEIEASEEIGLVVLFHLNNVSGYEHTQENTPDAIYDWTGNGFNGTLGNGTAGTSPSFRDMSRFKGGFEFDGVNDFIHINDTDAAGFFRRYNLRKFQMRVHFCFRIKKPRPDKCSPSLCIFCIVKLFIG